MTCGIYMIQNKINNKIYIGQAVDIERRWGNHRWELRSNHHVNKHLQRAWNKYEENNFEFTIICECNESQLNTMEEYYIFELMSYDDRVGYNKNYGGGGCRPTEETRKKKSESAKIAMSRPEVRKKISEANKGRTMSEEARNKISEARKGKTASEETRKKLSEFQKGKIISEETRKKMSEAAKGKTASEETRKKLSESLKIAMNRPEVRKKMSEAMKGENNPNYGKPRSEETRKKISDGNKGESSHWYGKFGFRHNRSIPVVQLTLEGELVKVYGSGREAERSGFGSKHVSECCRGKRKTHRGYKWMYLSDYEAMKKEG